MEINIGNKKVGGKNPIYFIAEIGVNHCGDIDLAAIPKHMQQIDES